MSGTSGSYNAVTWLLDRNVDEGRGGKLAFNAKYIIERGE